VSGALRKIGEQVLEQCFTGLSPLTRDELATSLVRQWLGHDGNAVILTPEFTFWFRRFRTCCTN